ncbi:MAG: RING-HC finger protein, partial [bacterium]
FMVESNRQPRPNNNTSVYYDDEDVEDEFNCSICWNLMLQPVTTPCGHTFCKSCLQTTLNQKRECIMCRTPVF